MRDLVAVAPLIATDLDIRHSARPSYALFGRELARRTLTPSLMKSRRLSYAVQ
jgi:hypothetical protein